MAEVMNLTILHFCFNHSLLLGKASKKQDKLRLLAEPPLFPPPLLQTWALVYGLEMFFSTLKS